MGLMSQFKALDYLNKIISGDNMISNGDCVKLPYIPHRIKKAFQRTTCEEQGVPSEYILNFFQELSNTPGIHAHGCMIIRHSKMIASGFWHPFSEKYAHMTYSMCKTIISLAIGCLIDEGVLKIDEKVLDIFPEYNNLFLSKRVRQVTVEHLLTMTSGVTFNEMGSFIEKDWVKSALEEGVRFEPGDFFEYNSLNSYLLAAVIFKKAGMGVVDYLTPRIFEPLGIENIIWEKCPRGIEKGGWGLSIRLEDMAKLGQLMLSNGEWEGQQLISQQYIKAATTPHSTTKQGGADGYGYQVWMFPIDGAYQFNGLFGQYVIVIPKHDMVIAINAASENLFPDGNSLSLVRRYFSSPPFSDVPLEPSKRASERLEHDLKQLTFMTPLSDGTLPSKLPWYKRVFSSIQPTNSDIDIMRKFSNKTYACKGERGSLLPFVIQILHNNYTGSIKKISFMFEENVPTMILYDIDDVAYKVRLGFEKPQKSQLEFKNESYTVFTQSEFKRDEDDNWVLKCKINFIETPHTRLIKCYFMGDNKIVLRFNEIPSVRISLESLGIIDTLPLAKNEFMQYKFYKILEPIIEAKAILQKEKPSK